MYVLDIKIDYAILDQLTNPFKEKQVLVNKCLVNLKDVKKMRDSVEQLYS